MKESDEEVEEEKVDELVDINNEKGNQKEIKQDPNSYSTLKGAIFFSPTMLCGRGLVPKRKPSD